MGSNSFSYSDWTHTKSSYAGKTHSTIYKASSLDDSIDPSKMKNGVRESRDSDVNPESSPIIIGLDFTGSMGFIPEYFIKEGLGELFNEIYTRKPVSDPHVLFCGIGDYDAGDRAPFQVSQFEAGCQELVNGLEKFWLNGCGGGGNSYESYDVPYYFAAYHTSIDSMEKRNKKGFIFTIGDEPPPKTVKAEAIKQLFGSSFLEKDVSFEDILTEVYKSYIPYHIIIEEGSYVKSHGVDSVYGPWKSLLGQNAILCSDHKKLAEIIVSILQVNAGISKTDITSSWDGTTSLVVDKAISGLVSKSETSIIF